MVMYDPIWSSMILFGPLWSCMCGPICLYGHVWSLMVAYIPVWSRRVPHGPVWSYLVLYVPVWQDIDHCAIRCTHAPYWTSCNFFCSRLYLGSCLVLQT